MTDSVTHEQMRDLQDAARRRIAYVVWLARELRKAVPMTESAGRLAHEAADTLEQLVER